MIEIKLFYFTKARHTLHLLRTYCILQHRVIGTRYVFDRWFNGAARLSRDWYVWYLGTYSKEGLITV